MNGILVINKPAGWTSFDVVAKLRGILHMKRLGHAGTLDPMATGVLPVFVGGATKACGILPNEDKAYLAEFQLGRISDTQDSTGQVQDTGCDVSGIFRRDILQAIPIGEIEQIPPMYSAVKVGGKKLYELAREGKEIERKQRRVQIYMADCPYLDRETGIGRITVHCGKGTYIRTLIHDMGQSLGCGAVMTQLERYSACGFGIRESYSIEEVQKAADEGHAAALLVPIEKAFERLPKLYLSEKQTVLYRNGVKLALPQLGAQAAQGERFAVYGTPDGFLGTAFTDRNENVLRVERNLWGTSEL